MSTLPETGPNIVDDIPDLQELQTMEWVRQVAEAEAQAAATDAPLSSGV